MKKERIDNFLLSKKMHFTDLDFEQCVNEFLKEMEKGLHTTCSLEMLPAFVSLDEFDYSNKKAIAIDAGGTNLRIALISFDNKRNYSIEYLENYPMPGTYGPMEADAFFDALAENLKPVAREATDIGFGFSYPAEITPQRDGIIKYLVKELKVSGAEGLLLGENLKKALKKAGLDDNKNIVVLNDTVVALLGGKAVYPDHYAAYIGFILGTGFNTCYAEKVANIRKLGTYGDEKETMIINIESGGYDKITRGILDISYDQTTANPGVHQMEKMLAGAYIGALAGHVSISAAQDGLFSRHTAQKMKETGGLTTLDLSLFLSDPKGHNKIASLCDNNDDRQTLQYMAEVLIERAAFYTAAVLAATVIKSFKKGEGPVCIAAEGSTYYKLPGMKDKINAYLNAYLDKKGLRADIVHAEHAAITGAAIAALTNK